MLDTLDPKYRAILCDVWGVVHDGVSLYPGALSRLRRWRGEGRCVVLITNAPRTADAVDAQLARIGLPRDAYDFVETGGEAGIAALAVLGHSVGFIGTASDRALLEARGVEITDGNKFGDLACTGLEEGRARPADYIPDLELYAQRGIRMHCLNPDRIVVRDGVAEACAGALADIYQSLGGQVIWYGKPHATIYEDALKRAGNPAREDVLAVGDGLQTDMLGAAKQGFDAVFITGGIHGGGAFPDDFAEDTDLAGWRPILVVDSLE